MLDFKAIGRDRGGFHCCLLPFLALVLGLVFDQTAMADGSIPSLSLSLSEADQPEEVVPAIKILALLTVLSVAPAILLMMTSFTRIVIVLSFVRQAIGTPTTPPNQVLVGLSLFLTLFTMAPVIDEIKTRAYDPYAEKKITQDQAIEELTKPVKKFMLAETRESDLALFMSMLKLPQPQTKEEVSLTTLLPAFLISELKTAFQIGFIIYIPFLVIDMVISAILMAMGMMMLPPTIISLPFKLVLFVLVDGWSLIVGSVVRSYNTFT
jgi:flagellar biosynthesis protein FliP